MDYPLPLQQFSAQLAQQPHNIWLHQPVDRQWRTFTWAEVDLQARRIANGLQHQGLEPGDRIGLLAKNCAEWFIADLAIMMAGMVSVPIYTTAAGDTIKYVLQHSGTRAIFVGKLDYPEDADAAIPADIIRIAMPYPTISCQQQWQDWLQQYPPLAVVAEPQPRDTCTLCYTSGSTGVPKGVVLSFQNIAAASQCTIDRFGVTPGDRALSYLPLAHITERAVLEMVALGAGVEVYFVESMKTFTEDLRYCRPTCFLSVPRFWTRLQAQVLSFVSNKSLQRWLSIPLLSRVVAARTRKRMGLDQVRLFGSGTSPISPAVLEWFGKLGITISEGWGMTETGGLACTNVPYKQAHLGSCGRPLACIEMRTAPNGEILVRGDAVFSEYYRDPKGTAASFTDGWFNTGDLASHGEGAWKIAGRVSDQFRTSKGSYVAPVPIEALVSSEPDIDQVCVTGSGRRQPVALVVLNVTPTPDNEATRRQLTDLLNRVNGQLENHERLEYLIVCSEPWSIRNKLLTPTMKLKRGKLEALYSGLLASTNSADKILFESTLREQQATPQ